MEIAVFIIVLVIAVIWFMGKSSSQFPSLPIKDSYGDAEYGQDFRFHDDQDHVIRNRAQIPSGFLMAESGIQVAGTSHRPEKAERFMKGTERTLELERDPDNEYDRNAIKVMGKWKDASGSPHQEQLGFLPKGMAKEVIKDYPDMNVAAVLTTMFLPHDGKSPGIRFALCAPQKKKKS